MKNKVVLITGGTGSFGQAFIRHLLENTDVKKVIVYSRDEWKQSEMQKKFTDKRLRYFIGDVRDRDSVSKAIRGSDYVFHAAALKQVPSCEFFPLEAVATNVQGSANVLRSSLNFSVSSVVCLSTDKAVYPINAMGMSKALMEKTATSFARNNPKSKTKIAITRYGNVMFSRGSVIPLFIKQIKSGKPITVTDLNMTRFLMSLSDSVDLVNYAFENASSGDLLVRKAPAATVEVLVEALKQLFDVADAKTQLIGVRHGEKIYESLLSTEEMAHAIDQDTYFRVPLDTRGLDYSIYFEEGESRTEELSSYTSHNTMRLDVEGVKKLLLTLPEVRQELNPS